MDISWVPIASTARSVPPETFSLLEVPVATCTSGIGALKRSSSIALSVKGGCGTDGVSRSIHAHDRAPCTDVVYHPKLPTVVATCGWDKMVSILE